MPDESILPPEVDQALEAFADWEYQKCEGYGGSDRVAEREWDKARAVLVAFLRQHGAMP